MKQVWILFIAVAGGIVIGISLYLISKLFGYYGVWSAGVAGIAGMPVMYLSVKRLKIRWRGYVILCGILLGLISYGTYYYAEYRAFLQDTRDDITINNPSTSDDEANKIIGDYLREETGLTGFAGYIKLLAQEGFTVTDSYSPYYPPGQSNVSQETTPETLFRWLLEIIAITSGAAWIGYAQAKTPFCETENEWLKYDNFLGAVLKHDKKAFRECINSISYITAATYIKKSSQERSSWYIYAGRCNPGSQEWFVGILKPYGMYTVDAMKPVIMTHEQYLQFVKSIGHLGH